MADTDGSISISIDLTVGDAEKELARLKKRFLSLQADLTEDKVRKTALEKEFEQVSAQLDAIRSKNKNGVIPANDENAKALIQRVEQLNAEIDKTDDSIRNSEIALEGVKARYGEVAAEAERLGRRKILRQEQRGQPNENLIC